MTVESGRRATMEPGDPIAIRDGAARHAGTGGGPLRPGTFCQLLLRALEAAEGQTRRRKRDQSPDRIGLGVKRTLLEQAVAADPAPEAFEGWLMEQILLAPHAGAVRAMCEQIFLEYHTVARQPDVAAWLEAGAPSDDAEPSQARRDGNRSERPGALDRWHGTDDPLIACTCHLPQR